MKHELIVNYVGWCVDNFDCRNLPSPDFNIANDNSNGNYDKTFQNTFVTMIAAVYISDGVYRQVPKIRRTLDGN